METDIRRLTRLIGSGWTFAATLFIFTLEAGWLALTSRFPMAFDEAYHFGLIRFFSHHLDPLITHQQPDTYRYGAIVQGPSFLYHYLMSFPYRLIAAFAHSAEAQVMILRLLNVALAVAGLIIARKLLRFLRVSDPLANLIILVFAFTPVMTALSAQINYDNLLIPAVGLCVYATVAFTHRITAGHFDARLFLILLSLCAFSSLVKFTFLPVLVAISALVVWKTVGLARRSTAAGLLASARTGYAAMGTLAKVGLTASALLGALLFSRFYMVNLVRYHDPVPDCDQVLSTDACSKYYSWDANHLGEQYHKTHPGHQMNAPEYAGYWLLVDVFSLFGVIMPFYGLYHMSLAFVTAAALIGATAFACLAINFRRVIRGSPPIATLVVVAGVYLAFLFARNYASYLQLGRPAAITGRYLLPVLIYVYVLAALGVRQALSRCGRHAPAIKAVLAAMLIALFLGWGGFRQYVSQVNPVYGRLSPDNEFELKYPFADPFKTK